jgi:DNA repair exonuclease SbcCD ATPase subunit
MIIVSLKLKNFLKFEQVEISQLPDQGVIAIQGDNESGKSSIGEAIYFALFGRTSLYLPTELHRCVRWGARHAEVALEFETPDKKRFCITRTLNEQNHLTALLVCTTGELPPVDNLADVSARMTEICGMDSDQFSRSVYCSQLEFTHASHPHSINTLCGIDFIENAMQSIAADSSAEESVIAGLEKEKQNLVEQLDQLDSQLEELERQQKGLSSLNQELNALDQHRIQLNEQMKTIEQHQHTLTESLDQLAACSAQTPYLDWNNALIDCRESLLELDEVIPDEWGGTPPLTEALRGRMVDIESMLDGFAALIERLAPRRAALAEFLEENFTQCSDKQSCASPTHAPLKKEKALQEALSATENRRMFAMGGLASTALCYLIWALFFDLFGNLTTAVLITLLATSLIVGLGFFVKQSTRLLAQQSSTWQSYCEQLARARRESQELDELVTQPLVKTLQWFRDHADHSIREYAECYLDGPGADWEDTLRLQALFKDLQHHAQSLRERLIPILESLASRQELLARDKLEKLQTRDRLQRTLSELELSLRPAFEIEADIQTCQVEWERSQRQQRIFKTATELLSATGSQIADRFTQDLRKIIALILPSLTENRYEAIKVDPYLNVQVFATAKQDFVDFNEISNGTRRQIGLALRLALSEHMTDFARIAPQFVFLDEPFAFFDAARTTSTLAALPRLSSRLTQYFVVGQAFPDSAQFSRVIHCHPDTTRLMEG